MCDFPPFTDWLDTCNGNGQCITNACVCNEGYTGLSDWVNFQFRGCQVRFMFIVKIVFDINFFFFY